MSEDDYWLCKCKTCGWFGNDEFLTRYTSPMFSYDGDYSCPVCAGCDFEDLEGERLDRSNEIARLAAMHYERIAKNISNITDRYEGRATKCRKYWFQFWRPKERVVKMTYNEVLYLSNILFPYPDFSEFIKEELEQPVKKAS